MVFINFEEIMYICLNSVHRKNFSNRIYSFFLSNALDLQSLIPVNPFPPSVLIWHRLVKFRF